MVSQPRQRILFADNDADFRTTRAELLDKTNYQVIQANGVEEAEEILQYQWVHLALFDIRMRNDNDERDISGLTLAKKLAYRVIPKIMLTGFPTYENAREALGTALDDLPAAVDFVAKPEGSSVLLRAIENAFTRHVRINWDLVIQFAERQPVTFPYLVTLIDPELTGERFQHRTAELEDTFRRLFYHKQQIRLDRLLWQHQGRLALSVFTFYEETPPEAFVVVCGTHAAITDEAQKYQSYAPKALGPTGTALSLQTETMHFAANVYALAQTDLANVQTLAERYQAGTEKDFHDSLTHLMQHTLAGWHHNARLVEEIRTLATLYRTRLALTEDHIPQAVFDMNLQHLIRQFPTLGIRVERVAGNLTIALQGHTCSYPDPALFLDQMPPLEQPVLMANTPGHLTGDNILTDTQGQTWLTDFAAAGLAPLAWNEVTLEALIRFDWIETSDLYALLRLEEALITQPLRQFNVQDIEPPTLRKPARAIRALRRLSPYLEDTDPRSYQVLQQTFDDLDESQRRRLNTAISRLRERLGDDPREPRYLHTEPGGGYRLIR